MTTVEDSTAPKAWKWAKEWACAMPGQDGYANCYKLDSTDMKVLNLSEDRYHVLNWLAVLAMNRDFRASTPLGIEGKEYIIREFGVDLMPYDIIRGYRADDSYFAFARASVSYTHLTLPTSQQV